MKKLLILGILLAPIVSFAVYSETPVLTSYFAHGENYVMDKITDGKTDCYVVKGMNGFYPVSVSCVYLGQISPVVNVTAPAVNVAPPVVHIAPPVVNVSAPNVSCQVPVKKK